MARKCIKCGRIIRAGEETVSFIVKLKNGTREKVFFCFECLQKETQEFYEMLLSYINTEE